MQDNHKAYQLNPKPTEDLNKKRPLTIIAFKKQDKKLWSNMFLLFQKLYRVNLHHIIYNLVIQNYISSIILICYGTHQFSNELLKHLSTHVFKGARQCSPYIASGTKHWEGACLSEVKRNMYIYVFVCVYIYICIRACLNIYKA